MIWSSLALPAACFDFPFIFPPYNNSSSITVQKGGAQFRPMGSLIRRGRAVSTATTTHPSQTETVTPAFLATPNATMVQGIEEAFSQAVIQSLTPLWRLTSLPPHWQKHRSRMHVFTPHLLLPLVQMSPCRGLWLLLARWAFGSRSIIWPARDIYTSTVVLANWCPGYNMYKTEGQNLAQWIHQFWIPYRTEEKFNISVKACKASPGLPTLSLKPIQKLAQLTPRFLLSRYLLEFPADAPALMKYGEEVWDWAEKGPVTFTMTSISVTWGRKSLVIFLGKIFTLSFG